MIAPDDIELAEELIKRNPLILENKEIH